ncbi:MAG TPA: hypothetical protein VLU73_06235 [Methylococcaceae bacterium]|nr:hypothetical protein [Methylococcaceae bacterium]
MSIVKLQKVTFAGLLEDKERLLDGADGALGRCDALAFLKSYSQRRRQVRDPARFDAVDVERQALEVRRRL